MKKIWSWLVSPTAGGVVGIIGLGLAVYATFIYERKPELSVSVESVSKVFDLHRPVGGLEVSYAGENLRSSKKNLWVLTVSIKNVGNSEVRKGDYDDRAPLGLEVLGATIAERPTLKAGVGYISKNLSATVDGDRVLFSPVILEPGDSFEVALLLLGSKSARPAVLPVGKVAGIRSIALVTPESPKSGKSIWSQAVSAEDFLAQPLRWAIYFFGTIVVFVMVAVAVFAISSPFEKIGEKKAERERRRRVQDYRRHQELKRESRYLLDRYVAEGEVGLIRVASYLRFLRRRNDLMSLSAQVDERKLGEILDIAFPYRHDNYPVAEDLRTAKLLEGDGVGLKVSDDLEQALKDICAHLSLDFDALARRYVMSPRDMEIGIEMPSGRMHQVRLQKQSENI